MKRFAWLWLATALCCHPAKENKETVRFLFQSPGDGFTALFNGRDFHGWNIQPDSGAWVVESGEIRCSGKNVPPYLIRTEHEYENFELFSEFKFDKGCNSGIFIHAPIPGAGRESRVGFEVQIMDDAGTPVHKGSSGAIYDVIAPKVNAMRPAGEWNQYRVLFDWPWCRIWLNGILIQEQDFSAHPVLKYRLRRGHIGLSNHASPVQYRNLWIKELPDQEQGVELFNGRDLAGWEHKGSANWQVRDGQIVADRGEGWLITKNPYPRFHLQTYIANPLAATTGKIYYRWRDLQHPGCNAELFNYPLAVEYMKRYGSNHPESVVPAFTYPWLLYQIVSADREAETRVAGYIVASQKLLQETGDHIAFYRAAGDAPLVIRTVRVLPLTGNGL